MARKSSRNGATRKSRRPAARPRPLSLEQLEDRVTPAVVFNQVFGVETDKQTGNAVLNSPPVYLIFWGSYWKTHASDVANVRGAVANVVSSAYLSGISQYGSNGIATLSPATTFSTSGDPSQGFQGSVIDDVVQKEIDNNVLPESDGAGPQTPIYAVITPPGILSAQGSNVVGFNTQGDDRDPVFGIPPYEDDPIPEIWCSTGTNSSGAVNVPRFSLIFSHEIAELMSDTGSGGYEVNPGPNWVKGGGGGSGNQIGDYEGNKYAYPEPNGTFVQPFWSRADQGWLVEDGNSLRVNVNPIWNTDASGNPSVNGGWTRQASLVVNGGQLPFRLGDTITLDTTPGGGVQVTLDGQVTNFPKNFISQGITINLGDTVGSTVNVRNLPANLPLTIHGLRDDTINIGADGSVQGILSTITIDNHDLSNTITVDDSADKVARTVTLSSFTAAGGASYGSVTGLAPAEIDYSYIDTASITVKTGAGGDVVNVLATGSATDLVGNGAAVVNVGNAGSTAGIGHILTLTNPSSRYALNVDDSAGPAVVADLSSLPPPNDLAFGEVSGLSAQGDIIYKYLDTSSVTVRTPRDGTVFVEATGAPTTVVSGGATTVDVGGFGGLQGIRGRLTFENPHGLDTITLDDSQDATARTVTLDRFIPPSDSSFGSVVGLTPAEIDYENADTRSVTIDTGSGGDVVNVRVAVKPVNLVDNGVDRVNLGNGGGVQDILGAVDVKDQSHHTTLNVDDSGDTRRRTVTITAAAITGLAPAAITYGQTELFALSVKGGAGSSDYNVSSTPGVSTTLTAGAGKDLVHVRQSLFDLVTDALGALDVVGNANTTLLWDDRALGVVTLLPPATPYSLGGSTYTIRDTSITRDTQVLGPVPAHHARVDFTNVGTVQVEDSPQLITGSDTFVVYATPRAGTLTVGVNSPGGRVNVGTPGTNMDAIGALTVRGHGDTQLLLDDEATQADIRAPLPGFFTFDSALQIAPVFHLNVGQVTRFGSRLDTITDPTGQVVSQQPDVSRAAITYSRVRALDLRSGAVKETFIVDTASAATPVTFDAGAGGATVTLGEFGAVVGGEGGSRQPSFPLPGIQGRLTVNGAGVTDVFVDDRGDAGPGGAYDITGKRTVWTGPASSFTLGYSQLTTLHVLTGGANNTLLLNDTGAVSTFVVDGPGQDAIQVGDASHNLDGVAAPVTVQGNGQTVLTVDDQANHNSRTVNSFRNSYSTFTVTDAQVSRHNLVLSTDGPATYDTSISYGGLAGLTVQGGRSGNVFNVESTAAGTPVAVNAGAGSDTVTVGSAANSLDTIRSALTVDGQGGVNTLTLNDQGSAGREEYDVHSTQITREPITSPPTSPTQTVTYAGFAAVTVNGADASSNQFFALGTPAGTSVSLNAGSGGFNQFLAFDEFSPTDAPPATDNLLGPVAFHGHHTSDFGERIDSFAAAGHTFTLSAVGAVSTVQRDGAADLTYDGLSQLILAGSPVGGNQVNVRGVAPGVFQNIVIYGGDQAVVGSLAPLLSGTTANILGPVAFTDGGAGASTVTLVDSSDLTSAGRRVTVAPPPSSGGLGSSVVGLSGAPDLAVYFRLNTGSAVALNGGVGDKTFALQAGALAGVALSIDGGVGSNTLDYSGWTGDITVNLQLGTATGVDGGVRNIRNVTGSVGNDLLVGDANANVLVGGTGRNVILGGGGADQITGGGGDNLLVGGSTDYDQNAAALDLIMQEWLLASDFATRVAALQSGSGVHLVSGDTVHPDGQATVTPGPGNNWVIA